VLQQCMTQVSLIAWQTRQAADVAMFLCSLTSPLGTNERASHQIKIQSFEGTLTLRNATPQGRMAPGTICVIELMEIHVNIFATSPSQLCPIKFLGPLDFCTKPPTFCRERFDRSRSRPTYKALNWPIYSEEFGRYMMYRLIWDISYSVAGIYDMLV
jgi:hypothetical protein